MFDQLHMVSSELTSQGKRCGKGPLAPLSFMGTLMAIMAEEYVHNTGTVRQITSKEGHLSTYLVKVHDYGYHGYYSDGN